MNCAVHTQTQAVAYCRTCGKALCEDCKRDVMGAIYCEPCIAARLQGQPAPPSAAGVVPPVVAAGAPSPVFAGILGLIPGVGAMYNGQFVKAFVHVVIFVMLIIAVNSIHWAFGWMIAFFVFYMAFEAYKTADARRLGLPAPDPLGLDKMFGLQESQSHLHTGAEVPPASVGSPAAPPSPLQVETPPPPPQDNAPVGAVVLIALGVVFLLSNFGMFHIDHLWPLFLIGIGLWIAYKRTGRRV
jgi:TM2 domain-containing membrane protein YozV